MIACAKPLQPASGPPFELNVKTQTPRPVTPRGRFQFSNAAAQQAEAHLNLKEAIALAERRAPPHLRPAAIEGTPSTPAGTCFRKVTAILQGKHGR